MEALRIIQRPQNGKLIITVPEELIQEREFEVLIRPISVPKDSKEKVEQFFKKLKRTGFSMSDDAVYDQ
jgi:hypothetical protein